MAGAVTVPSQSLLLASAMARPLSANTVNKLVRPLPQSAPSKDLRQTSDATAATTTTTTTTTKRKQSKSRNGCVTCKAKRLKCDESKPTCQQCARRSVTCGGYKKDFKWRPFEEPAFTAAVKSPARAKKSPPQSNYMPMPASASSASSHSHLQVQPQPPIYHPPPEVCSNYSFDVPKYAYYPLPSGQPQYRAEPPPRVLHDPIPSLRPVDNVYPMPQRSSYVHNPSPNLSVDSYITSPTRRGSSAFESESVDTQPTVVTTPSNGSPGQSPRLVDLLLPGTDLTVPPEEYSLFREQHESFYQPTGLTPPMDVTDDDDDDVEEVPRNTNTGWKISSIRQTSPASSDSSSNLSDSSTIPARVISRPTSAEMLTRRFDRETCGILSVKDGPTENPWRMLILPLAQDCPALYHAIVSMTSFHQSRDMPTLRIQGIDHMRTSVHALASGLENMRVDAAISTTLVLAFSESWDQHISTGINHIKGAKMLIDKALVQHSRVPMYGEELARLQFLCNTWTYMDVIARLTSTDGDESDDYNSIFDSFNMGGMHDAQLDPLMGCASTLFPVIGRVANLVRTVRQNQTDHNSPAVISQAIELKRRLEDWMPPSYIEDPEDETTSPNDSIKTATAYQYATLLYLHQAVPEIPSLPSLTLAQKICREIATVPPTSRSTIVHIFPLMAAGCEVISEGDRQWVCERWDMMARRMKIGIIEKCLDVTREVWARRDASTMEHSASRAEESGADSSPPISLKRSFSVMSEDIDADSDAGWLEPYPKRRASSSLSPRETHGLSPTKSEMDGGLRRSDMAGTENLLPEFTVNGRLHWLGVMTDWGWEVLLG